jgi:hypothetical protein
MQRHVFGTPLSILVALLACKGGSDKSGAGSTSASATAASEPEEKLDKAQVCGLFGAKGDSEACTDCIDDAEMGDRCAPKARAWESCTPDVDKLGSRCAGSCINQCVGGQKACCECTTDCVAKINPGCLGRFLAFQKCTLDACKKSCG